MQLVADVGGTNARLALARDNQLVAGSTRSFRGDGYDSFDDVVTQFLAEAGGPLLSAVCVAVAGPVSAGRAVLTNRDWQFSVPRLQELTGAPAVALINDLTAWGYATMTAQPRTLRPAPEDRARNGQSLVVNAGTGFNVCALRVLPGGGVLPLEAEEGHTALPATIAARIDALLGPGSATETFASTEALFAGRGFGRFHALRTDRPFERGEAVAAAAAAGDAEAGASFGAYAELFGLLLRELALRFMPREGMWLVGSVSRQLEPWLDRVEAAFLSVELMHEIPENTPLLMFDDGLAALQGCLNAITR